jgi:hypothetical protein
VPPCIVGITGTHHCTQLLLEMWSHQIFARAGLKLWSSPSLPPEQLGLQGWATMSGILTGFWRFGMKKKNKISQWFYTVYILK